MHSPGICATIQEGEKRKKNAETRPYLSCYITDDNGRAIWREVPIYNLCGREQRRGNEEGKREGGWVPCHRVPMTP